MIKNDLKMILMIKNDLKMIKNDLKMILMIKNDFKMILMS